MTDQLAGYQTPTDIGSDFNALHFIVQQMLAKMHTATLVKVISCTNSGGVSPVGTVTVQPLVNLLTGDGKPLSPPVVRSLPYLRVQGGANAIIIDPQAGDIGIAVFADRDISSVKANKAQSNPGSRRRFSWADGMYLGGTLNGTPTQYVQFNSSGITVTTPGDVTVNAGGNVSVTATGSATITAATAVIKATSIALQNAGAALKSLLTSAFQTWAESHVHTDPQGGTTSTPTTSPGADAQTSVVTAE